MLPFGGGVGTGVGEMTGTEAELGAGSTDEGERVIITGEDIGLLKIKIDVNLISN